MDNHSFNAGFTGILATSTSVGISLLAEIEQWLRISSLCIGILVGAGSLVIIFKNWNKSNTK